MFHKMSVILIFCAMATSIFMPLGIAIAAGSDNGLDAVIVGSGVFNPGTTAQVQIVIQNNNVVNKMDAGAAQSGMSQYYGAAVGLTATLFPGNAPITIKAGKMLFGTLQAGAATAPVPFIVDINDDAQPGVYQAQLILTYTTLVSTSIKTSGEINLNWSANNNQVVSLTLEIQEGSVPFEITSLESELKPGTNNELKVAFKNVGNETARDATVEVIGYTPLSVTDNTSFLGTLEPGDSAMAIFGIQVAGDAILKEYALDAFVTYTNANGDQHQSKDMAVPVLVGRTTSSFAVTRGQFLDGLAGAAAIAVVVLIWYFVYRARRKKAS
jgi:hypothetical protein